MRLPEPGQRLGKHGASLFLGPRLRHPGAQLRPHGLPVESPQGGIPVAIAHRGPDPVEGSQVPGLEVGGHGGRRAGRPAGGGEKGGQPDHRECLGGTAQPSLRAERARYGIGSQASPSFGGLACTCGVHGAAAVESGRAWTYISARPRLQNAGSPARRFRRGDVMTTYTESSSSTRAVEESGSREVWILGRRRRFVVPGAYQWRSLALLGGLTVLLMGALDAALIALVESGSAHVLQIAPELRAFLVGQDRDMERLIVVGSLVTVIGVLMIGLLETHRTAGPLYNLTRALERFPIDGLRTRLRFRKDDHFPELEQAFNKMAADLEARALGRVTELARITSRLQQAADG